ncbi:peptide ABC transporter permease [Cohnella kolymensis]|uniref:Peptide ABC transporter permease n=1 Tax=Cohnella kolymensis TaxID=1590652 RepID=A0ABR5A1Z2_9BACL|nr:ABC transporter permease [Cohnella kolymensis]KIL34638.1 peptide ABC transporter permease [Cohnella kolymensis]
MARYFIGKFVSLLFSLFILATVTFFLMKAIPGDPFTAEKAVPPEILAKLNAFYGLDKPIWQQYITYLQNLLNFDLGMSMRSQYQTVSGIIADSFIYSLQLGLIAVVVSVIIGVALGLLAALYYRKWIDTAAMIVAVLGVSVPSFVVAAFIQEWIGNKLDLLNPAGLNGPADFIMPVIALSALPVAFIARLTRSSMLEVLTADFVKTAKSKGLRQQVIIIRHALRNGIMPVVTYLGPMTANVVTGSVIVEQIFGIPGLGPQFVTSVSNRDYTLIMGITLFYAVILMIARLLTDIAYAFIDPRIELTNRKEAA